MNQHDAILRAVHNDDHEFLVSLHNDPEVLKNVTDPTPITLESHMNWWNKTIVGNPREIRLIFDINGERAGFTKFYSIDHENRSCVLGADLHKDFRGKGLAKTMWKLMLNRCFYIMDMHRVSLTTAEYNLVAIKIYHDLGFKDEGRRIQSLFRNNKYYDEICMYILNENWHAT